MRDKINQLEKRLESEVDDHIKSLKNAKKLSEDLLSERNEHNKTIKEFGKVLKVANELSDISLSLHHSHPLRNN